MRAILLPLAALLGAVPVAVTAFKEGPYPNVTGGFGEQTCHVCHLDNPMNAPGGRLSLTGIPPSYRPGVGYPITVTIARDDVRRAGFEIAARFASGRERGKQAGRWRLLDGRAQLIPGAIDPSIQFVQHTLAGSRVPTPGSNSWTIEWTAPAKALGPVEFDIAANAANNDDSPLGDYIYVTTARSHAAR